VEFALQAVGFQPELVFHARRFQAGNRRASSLEEAPRTIHGGCDEQQCLHAKMKDRFCARPRRLRQAVRTEGFAFAHRSAETLSEDDSAKKIGTQ